MYVSCPPMRATCFARLNILDLIVLIIFDEACKSWNLHNRIFLASVVFLGRSFLSVRPILEHPPDSVLPLLWEIKFRTHTTSKVIVHYILIFMVLDRKCEEVCFWAELQSTNLNCS
jgi:hypothetical protein